MNPAFARLSAPPYYAAIFSSQRTDGGNGYGDAAERMVELARQQPGFLGVESTRGEDGFGITVSYWDSEDPIRAWRRHAEHAATRERGRAEWYRLSSCGSRRSSAPTAGIAGIAPASARARRSRARSRPCRLRRAAVPRAR